MEALIFGHLGTPGEGYPSLPRSSSSEFFPPIKAEILLEEVELDTREPWWNPRILLFWKNHPKVILLLSCDPWFRVAVRKWMETSSGPWSMSLHCHLEAFASLRPPRMHQFERVCVCKRKHAFIHWVNRTNDEEFSVLGLSWCYQMLPQ